MLDERPCSAGKKIFTALSYNIHECVGADGRRDPSRIAEVLKESDAAVIGLQEVHCDTAGIDESHQMNYLAKSTGFQAIAGPALQRRNGEYGNALLTNQTILQVNQLDLSIPGREPRGAIDAVLDVEGTAVRVIVTHLGLRAWERRLQVARLLVTLAERRADMLAILSDINEWLPASRPLRSIQRYLGKTRRLRTFPSYFPVFCLDRIWVSPASSLVDLSIINSALTRVASDHLPVRAIIETPPPNFLH